MRKRSVKPFRPVHPSPAALVTSVAEDGRPNVLTLGEVFNVSIREPVILGIAIAKPRYSHELISATGEYVVNLPTSSMAETVDRCGSVSGRAVDKFARFGLTPLPAEKVKPPLIAECPISVECRVIGIQEVGDHDLFLGEALAEHVAEEAIDDKGQILVDKLDPLCYLHSEYWSCGRRLGRHGFSRK
ncbi:MAG: flavin reductase family protein [Planctomycetota bacterium]|jgi:flavin reductase (DIM6/NTAB) family NADH-FMN oxidoreductase RutF